MAILTPTRRGFLGFMAAPAIVTFANIMPVRLIDWSVPKRPHFQTIWEQYVNGRWIEVGAGTVADGAIFHPNHYTRARVICTNA